MILTSGRTASVARRALIAVAIAAVLSHVPARAGLSFGQIVNERTANENTRHQAVMKEFEYERKMADQKLADQLKICTTANCKAEQRAAQLRTQNQLDVQEEHENAVHAKKMAQIKADIAAEEKKLKAQTPKTGEDQ